MTKTPKMLGKGTSAKDFFPYFVASLGSTVNLLTCGLEEPDWVGAFFFTIFGICIVCQLFCVALLWGETRSSALVTTCGALPKNPKA